MADEEAASPLPTTKVVNGDQPVAAAPKVQMRNKAPRAPPAEPPAALGVNGGAESALSRALNTLHENTPEMDDNNEEMRRLDNQLTHLNEYVDKVEARLNAHNAKLRETLQKQRADRENRRKSFHERLQTNREEDEKFQVSLQNLLNDISLARSQPTKAKTTAAE